MIARVLAVTLAMVVAGRTALTAQTGRALMAQGVAAYGVVDYDVAAALLARALAATDENVLEDSARAAAYLYLGAAEFYRGRWQAATEAFDRALAADPRHRADTLVFAPEVTDLFEAVRRQTAYLSLRPMADTTIPAGAETRLARVYTSFPQRIVAELSRAGGGRARGMYTGGIEDSLDLQWNGLDSTDTGPLIGRLVLRISSRSSNLRERTASVPLEVTALLADTIPHPAPPAQVADSAAQLRRRAQRGGWPAARSLAVGTLGGLAAVLLPHIVSAEPGTGQAHYAIGGAIGLAGIVGFVAQRPSGPLDAGGHDREALREWRRRMDEIREENADRRKVIRLRIVSGNASTERIP